MGWEMLIARLCIHCGSALALPRYDVQLIGVSVVGGDWAVFPTR